MKKIIVSILINILFSSQWGIDTTYSYILYKGSHPLHDWEGISKNIDFILSCNDNNACNLTVSTNLESLNSGNDSRDSNMLWYTESFKYPKVSFQSNNFKFYDDFDTSIEVYGDINFHGVTKSVPINIKLYKENQSLWGICNFNIDLNDYNIDRPSLLMMKISSLIKIESKLKIVSIE